MAMPIEPAQPGAAEMPADLSPRHLARRLLELLVLVVLVAILISALPGLGSIRRRFDQVDPGFLALIFALELASVLSYVVAFRGVFCRRLGWGFSYQLGMAEQATNVLLPTGGAGGLALGAWALRQGGMRTEHIGRRSVTFFLITSAANFLVVVVVGTLLLAGILKGTAPTVPTLVFTLAGLAAIAFVAALPALLQHVDPNAGRRRVGRLLRGAVVSLADGVRDTGVLLRSGSPAAVGGSAGYMGFDIAALAAAFAAFEGVPPLGPFLFAYVIGQLGGLIPLPGGIGGTDGGLIGGLVLYGAPLSQAVAAVLVYRAFQLCMPSLLGAVAFVQLRRRLSGSEQPAAMCAPLGDPIDGGEAARATV
jgi:uncharacterized membrane protein YbhN (UPF0104 family)